MENIINLTSADLSQLNIKIIDENCKIPKIKLIDNSKGNIFVIDEILDYKKTPKEQFYVSWENSDEKTWVNKKDILDKSLYRKFLKNRKFQQLWYSRNKWLINQIKIFKGFSDTQVSLMLKSRYNLRKKKIAMIRHLFNI
jgi:hypothetical protein